jgi:glycosyltransferase involved in cell wall biosynthesis
MNLWIFNHYAVGPGSSGFTRHYDLARELVKKGYKVAIIAASFNYQTKKEERQYKKGEWYQIEMLDGVKFIWIKTIKYKENDYKRVINMLEYSIKAYFIKNVLKDQPTHVIGSLMHPFAAITGAKVAKNKKAFFIFEERDLWPQSMIDLGNASPTSFKVKMLRKIERWLINSSDKILLLFDKAQQYMLQNGVAKEKLMVVSNGVQLENYTNNLTKKLPAEVSAVFEKHAGKLIAVYTGAHGMANNLDMVLDAAKQLEKQQANDVHFIFLGDGVHKSELENRKRDENIENVTFLSSIKKEHIPNFLRKADVGLLPLHDSPVFNWGISPNKMYDYMAAKLPVVIVTDIEQDALHQENPSILIRENQAENLVKLLSEMQSDRQKAEELGGLGHEFMLQYCTWETLAEDFLRQLK